MPEKLGKVSGLDEQLRIQNQIARVMRSVRHQHGALDLETIEPQAVVSDGQIVALRLEAKNRAQNLIEDFMIAANGVSAQFLNIAAGRCCADRGSPEDAGIASAKWLRNLGKLCLDSDSCGPLGVSRAAATSRPVEVP